MTELPEPAAEKPSEPDKHGPANPSQTNFAGALLLSVLLTIVLFLNFFGDKPVAPSWLAYGLMFGILFLLGVDVSKIFRGRGGP